MRFRSKKARVDEVSVTENDRTPIGVGRDVEHSPPKAMKAQARERILARRVRRAAVTQQLGDRIAEACACAQKPTGAAHDDRLPLGELIPIPPRCELGTKRGADAHELQTFTKPREPDVLRGQAEPGEPEHPLALLYRFPPLFERREVPLMARCAQRPQPTASRVECHTAPDGKRLERLVRAEVGVAEQAGAVHGGFQWAPVVRCCLVARKVRAAVATLVNAAPAAP